MGNRIMWSNNRKIKDYPSWTCWECGSKHGKRSPRIATWHYGKCDVCGENNNVTEPRDFGGFANWFKKNKKQLDLK